jgi:hypothetical protein
MQIIEQMRDMSPRKLAKTKTTALILIQLHDFFKEKAAVEKIVKALGWSYVEFYTDDGTKTVCNLNH